MHLATKVYYTALFYLCSDIVHNYDGYMMVQIHRKLKGCSEHYEVIKVREICISSEICQKTLKDNYTSNVSRLYSVDYL